MDVVGWPTNARGRRPCVAVDRGDGLEDEQHDQERFNPAGRR
jgi:hypothetical protein